MKSFRARSTISICLLSLFRATAFSQALPPSETDAVRVTVSMNADGTRTVYRFDGPNHKATATTTDPDGKVRSKTRYQLDDAGRFATGVVFGPDGKFRFKSQYKYDSAGRILEESQLGQDNALQHKIVYSYDAAGKPTGYSIFDEKDKLISHTSAPAPSPTAKPRK
jgi:hypothetical protein